MINRASRYAWILNANRPRSPHNEFYMNLKINHLVKLAAAVPPCCQPPSKNHFKTDKEGWIGTEKKSQFSQEYCNYFSLFRRLGIKVNISKGRLDYIALGKTTVKGWVGGVRKTQCPNTLCCVSVGEGFFADYAECGIDTILKNLCSGGKK